MAHQLACLTARCGKAHAVDDVVETRLQLLQQLFAGHALGAGGLLKVIAELFFQREIDALGFLLFAQLQTVADDLGFAVLAMLSGGVVTLLDRTFFAETICALEEQLHSLAAAKTTYCSGVTCHFFSSLSQGRSVYANGVASFPILKSVLST